MSILICSLKSMGKILQNELYAVMHVRYLQNCLNACLLYHFSQWKRKMAKNFLAHISANYSNAIFLKSAHLLKALVLSFSKT